MTCSFVTPQIERFCSWFAVRRSLAKETRAPVSGIFLPPIATLRSPNKVRLDPATGSTDADVFGAFQEMRACSICKGFEVGFWARTALVCEAHGTVRCSVGPNSGCDTLRARREDTL